MKKLDMGLWETLLRSVASDSHLAGPLTRLDFAYRLEEDL